MKFLIAVALLFVTPAVNAAAPPPGPAEPQFSAEPELPETALAAPKNPGEHFYCLCESVRYGYRYNGFWLGTTIWSYTSDTYSTVPKCQAAIAADKEHCS
jgi:hypothetical protein